MLFIIVQPGGFWSPDEYKEVYTAKFPHAGGHPRDKKITNKKKRKEKERKKERKSKKKKEAEEFYVL